MDKKQNNWECVMAVQSDLTFVPVDENGDDPSRVWPRCSALAVAFREAAEQVGRGKIVEKERADIKERLTW